MTDSAVVETDGQAKAAEITLEEAGKNLPALPEETRPYQEADDEERKIIEQLMDEIDLKDSATIIYFGAGAQEQVTSIADQMLEGVRNKDIGKAGKTLNDMVATLRGFNIEDLDPGKKVSFWARLFGRAKPLAEIFQRYEEVRKQIDAITAKLEGHKTKLLTDIVTLDRLYEATLQYFHKLDLYIAAGEEKLRRLDEEVIPAMAARVEESDDVLPAQELRDMRAARDDLERRVHDLHLTRQVALQSLPSIRLVQENDKGLVTKINSTLINTVPLWRQQLATAVAIFRSGEAARSVKAASDLTNELLEDNAANLKEANRMARQEMERGVFDIESIKKANTLLIETIEESLQIADEGRKKREEAMAQLVSMEQELKNSLSAAHHHATQPERGGGTDQQGEK